ncbi:MAG TPA: SRPBCC family protein [Cytophagales bacterium]|nr:SRPBCC family protein [Cytophagales bacterium]
MKVYHLEAVQTFPISIEAAWDFFSTPINLHKITPPEFSLKVLEDYKEEKAYAGQIINYIMKPLWGIPVRWTTEITHVAPLHYFVDQQLFGPYALWHHKHFFKSLGPHAVEMVDSVHYALPFGLIGAMAHHLFVRKRLQFIFDYRRQVLEQEFGKLS